MAIAMIVASCLGLLAVALYVYSLSQDSIDDQNKFNWLRHFWEFVENKGIINAPQAFVRNLPFVEMNADIAKVDKFEEMQFYQPKIVTHLNELIDRINNEPDSKEVERLRKELRESYYFLAGAASDTRTKRNKNRQRIYLLASIFVAVIGSCGLAIQFHNLELIEYYSTAFLVSTMLHWYWITKLIPNSQLELDELRWGWLKVLHILLLQTWLGISILWMNLSLQIDIKYAWLVMILAFVCGLGYGIYGLFAVLHDILSNNSRLKLSNIKTTELLFRPFGVFLWVMFSFVVTLLALSIGNWLKPSDPIPSSGSVLCVNAVSDGITVWVSVKLLAWSISSNRFVWPRIFVAVLADLFWSGILACLSLYIGLYFYGSEISLVGTIGVLQFVNVDGEAWYFGTYALLMHTAFLPTLLVILITLLLLLVASPTAWVVVNVFKEAHASVKPYKSLATAVGYLGAAIAAVATIVFYL